MKEYFPWISRYNLGIQEIDDQHKKIVNAINLLSAAMEAKKGNLIVEKILQDMMFYSLEHFSTEDEYIDKYPYPGKNDHKKEHNNYVTWVQGENAKIQDDQEEIAQELLKYLRSWWENHILKTDKTFVGFINEFGYKK